MAKSTVLIVDDELTLLRSLRDALRAQGSTLEVLTAGRADEALELMGLTEVDLVVTDLRMPGQDGLSFISTITQQYPNTRCILMTAHGDSETRNRSLANGAVSFIEKPFDLDKFISEVNRHLSPSGFTGRSLVGFSLMDILQLVSMSQQSLTMTVRSSEAVGSLYIDEGVLVHAETNTGNTGANAAYQIVSWSDGDIASSRGVAPDCQRTINLPLMTFLMEAAKFQDEAKRLKPIDDVKNILSSLVTIPGVDAALVLLVQTGAEVYGACDTEDFPRASVSQGMLNAYTVLKGALIDTPELTALQELNASFAEGEVLATPLLEGRFLAVLCATNARSLPSVKQAFTNCRGELVSALAEYESQFDLQDGGDLETLNFAEELEQALDSPDDSL